MGFFFFLYLDLEFFLEERKGTLSRRFARGCSLSLGRLVLVSLLAGAGMETSERALRERIVWRGERFPVWVSGPPGLHLIVEGRGEVS